MKRFVKLWLICVCMRTTAEEASLLVTKYPDKIILSNPGVLLISREQFFRGGESVCRNTSLQQMFMMMGQAEKAGSGVDKILRGWKASRWGRPYPNELLRPNKVELVMPLESLLDPRILTSLKDQLGSPLMILMRMNCYFWRPLRVKALLIMSDSKSCSRCIQQISQRSFRSFVEMGY